MRALSSKLCSMRLPPSKGHYKRPRYQKSRERRDHPGDIRHGQVAKRRHPLSLPKEIERLHGEGGKGGERAEKADSEQCPRPGGDERLRREPRQKAEEKATQEIHRQRSPGEHGAAGLVDEIGQRVATDGSRRASDCNREHMYHGRPFLPGYRGKGKCRLRMPPFRALPPRG